MAESTEKAGQRIRFLDVVLFVYGSKLFPTEGIQDCFNIGLRVACACILYLNLIVFIVITDHKEDIFLSLAFIFKYLVLIALHHYFTLQAVALRKIFEEHELLVEQFDGKYEPHKVTSKGKTWKIRCTQLIISHIKLHRNAESVGGDNVRRTAHNRASCAFRVQSYFKVRNSRPERKPDARNYVDDPNEPRAHHLQLWLAVSEPFTLITISRLSQTSTVNAFSADSPRLRSMRTCTCYILSSMPTFLACVGRYLVATTFLQMSSARIAQQTCQ